MGELKSIDADAKTLVVTTTEGSDMEFLYNESTEIVGAEGTTEGLSADTGSKAKVFYKTEEGKNSDSSKSEGRREGHLSPPFPAIKPQVLSCGLIWHPATLRPLIEQVIGLLTRVQLIANRSTAL